MTNNEINDLSYRLTYYQEFNQYDILYDTVLEFLYDLCSELPRHDGNSDSALASMCDNFLECFRARIEANKTLNSFSMHILDRILLESAFTIKYITIDPKNNYPRFINTIHRTKSLIDSNSQNQNPISKSDILPGFETICQAIQKLPDTPPKFKEIMYKMYRHQSSYVHCTNVYHGNYESNIHGSKIKDLCPTNKDNVLNVEKNIKYPLLFADMMVSCIIPLVYELNKSWDSTQLKTRWDNISNNIVSL